MRSLAGFREPRGTSNRKPLVCEDLLALESQVGQKEYEACI